MRSRIRISDSGLRSSSSSSAALSPSPRSHPAAGSAVSTFGVTALAFARSARVSGSRLLVLGPDEAALDPHRAVMVEDDESPAARDVGGVVGLPLGFQPLDLGLKLAETRIDIVGKFLGRSRCCSVRLSNSACAASRAA